MTDYESSIGVPMILPLKCHTSGVWHMFIREFGFTHYSFFRIIFYGGPSCEAVTQNIENAFLEVITLAFGLCVYAPVFSNFDRCPVNFIGYSDNETMLFNMQFFSC